MNYDEILAQLRSQLGDSREENSKILKEAADKFAKEGNAVGIEAVSVLLIENMPDSQREELKRLTYIDDTRLDIYHDKIVKLINESKYTEAKPMAEKLYKKIRMEYGEGEKAKFVSLRNPFEDNLCQALFKSDKILTRAPFDFAEFITTYGFLLVETGSPLDAIPVLETAIEYNPVDCGPKFELAEVYKLLKNKKKIVDISRDTLRVASSPIAIARCYANIGYALTDYREYEDAAAFYTASVMFAPNPAIPNEMQHLADLKGSPITHPSREKTIEIMKKYDIELGPNQDVINVAAQLANHYIEKDDIPNAVNALKITYNLTLDERVKDLILRYDPKSPLYVPTPEGKPSAEDTRVNITRTDNPSPQK